jgi:hypothetical protein
MFQITLNNTPQVLGGVTEMFLFLTGVFSDSKYCTILLETVGLRVPNRGFRDFGLFNVDFKFRNSPSARCVSATSATDSVTDLLNGCSASINMIG